MTEIKSFESDTALTFQAAKDIEALLAQAI